jgi:hypothetical protein
MGQLDRLCSAAPAKAFVRVDFLFHLLVAQGADPRGGACFRTVPAWVFPDSEHGSTGGRQNDARE